MRIDQIYVRQYGPVQKDLELDGDINVIRGPNESGKSLLVEAVLKQLSDGSVPEEVVDGVPEGFIQVSDGTTSEELRDSAALTEFCEEQYSQEVRDEELRNVFVIRSGDLTFHEGEDFYSHITDKLTGRRVEDIDEIKDALIDEGRLTSEKTLKISSAGSYNDADDQREQAEDLKSDINDYLDQAREEELDQVERNYYATKRREEELDSTIQDLKAAKEEQEKQDRLEQLRGAKTTITENLQELAELPDEEQLEDIDDRLEDLSQEEGELAELRSQKSTYESLSKWSIAAGVLAFGVLVGLGFPIIGVIGPLLFLIASGYFVSQARSIGGTIAEIDGKEDVILSDARAAGLEFDSREDVREKINDIKSQREELENENQQASGYLKNELGFEAEAMDEVVDRAEDEISELEDDIDDSVEIEFDESEYDEVTTEYEKVEERREELEQELEDHQEQLQDFREAALELDFNVFVGERLDVEVENLDALEELVDRLEEFVDAIESDARASRVAVEIFDEIQEEEQEETAELFEEGSRATEIFKEITDGRYETVTYDNESNQLEVVKSTGERFTPRELSDGTKDQLYLAIRVALGEQILEGNPGFFVMDDAFLTADADRLEKQADVVEQLADDGWQIIYLSSKDDAIDALSERSATDVIPLEALE